MFKVNKKDSRTILFIYDIQISLWLTLNKFLVCFCVSFLILTKCLLVMHITLSRLRHSQESWILLFLVLTQLTFTCSKSTRKAIEKWCEICSMSKIKTPARRQWRRFGVANVNFEHISHLFLGILLLIWNKQMFAGKAGCIFTTFTSPLLKKLQTFLSHHFSEHQNTFS